MTVYFAQARADQTTVKIGFTADLTKRQKNLSVSSPGGVSILASFEGGKETEDYLHQRFSEYRLGGEWFQFSDDIRDFLRDLNNGKQGLIPFRDEAVYMLRSTSEYGADALARSRQMVKEILHAEIRDIHDTIGAARHRVEKRFGFPASMLQRLIYRADMRDVSAGVYLHLTDIHQQVCRNRQANHAAHQSPNQAMD